MHDVLIIGGGPAGLQAALTLGRMGRDALVLDSGRYRNAAVQAMHNVLTNDGRHPTEFRAAVRSELADYPTVEVREGSAVEVRQRHTGDSWLVELQDGSEISARVLILPTGLRDLLPDVPGFAGQWGRTIHSCPFCHGHELAGRRIGIVDSPAAAPQAALLRPLSDAITIVPAPEAVELTDAGLRLDLGAGREPLVVDGLFAHVPFEQAAPFAAQLGLEMRESGAVAVDAFGHTSRPGVYAAGDLAHVAELAMPMPSVLSAAAAGLSAAASVVRDEALAATDLEESRPRR